MYRDIKGGILTLISINLGMGPGLGVGGGWYGMMILQSELLIGRAIEIGVHDLIILSYTILSYIIVSYLILFEPVS